MASIGFHESEDKLSAATLDMHRAIVSLMEELEAVTGTTSAAMPALTRNSGASSSTTGMKKKSTLQCSSNGSGAEIKKSPGNSSAICSPTRRSPAIRGDGRPGHALRIVMCASVPIRQAFFLILISRRHHRSSGRR